MSNWHPAAKRVPYSDAGPFVKAGAKIVWHTTETSGLPIYSGSAPHFTFNPATGGLWQHIPINRSAKSLEHPAGTVETNHANCVQVELIGYAKDSGTWGAGAYSNIAKLARWIEANAGVPSRCGVTFTDAYHVKRLSAADWLNYAGHLGHQHVPNNHHWDPGQFRIDLVLAPKDDPRELVWRKRQVADRREVKRLSVRVKALLARIARRQQLLK